MEQKGFEKMLALFRKVQPDMERQATPEESADSILKVINNSGFESAGRMLNHTGTDHFLSATG